MFAMKRGQIKSRTLPGNVLVKTKLYVLKTLLLSNLRLPPVFSLETLLTNTVQVWLFVVGRTDCVTTHKLHNNGPGGNVSNQRTNNTNQDPMPDIRYEKTNKDGHQLP